MPLLPPSFQGHHRNKFAPLRPASHIAANAKTVMGGFRVLSTGILFARPAASVSVSHLPSQDLSRLHRLPRLRQRQFGEGVRVVNGLTLKTRLMSNVPVASSEYASRGKTRSDSQKWV